MSRKSEKRKKEQDKKRAAKKAAMETPGGSSRYAQRQRRPPILGQQRKRMRHGEGFPPVGESRVVMSEDGSTVRLPARGDIPAAAAARMDRFGGWSVAMPAEDAACRKPRTNRARRT